MKNVFSVFLISAALVFSGLSIASAARFVAHIDVSKQTMTVKKDGRVLHRWKVSTAKAGHHTPRGTYSPKWLMT